LLASNALAAHLNLPELCRLISAANATEANRINTETVCTGEGLSSAFHKALTGLSQNQKVSHTICDMTGEPYRGTEYGYAMVRSTGRFEDGSDFQTPADCWGDQGAASGPLFIVLAAFAAAKGYAPGPCTLLWASSVGGMRAAVLLEGDSDSIKRETA
jgi:3-oxoacyl-[acyl-carrier-protein] synthase-1